MEAVNIITKPVKESNTRSSSETKALETIIKIPKTRSVDSENSSPNRIRLFACELIIITLSYQ
jgi:hypothetical protein